MKQSPLQLWRTERGLSRMELAHFLSQTGTGVGEIAREIALVEAGLWPVSRLSYRSHLPKAVLDGQFAWFDAEAKK